MAEFILNQFSFVQAALGEKQLGVNHVLIWRIHRDEEQISLRCSWFLPHSPGHRQNPQKRAKPRSWAVPTILILPRDAMALPGFLFYPISAEGAAPCQRVWLYPFVSAKGKTSPCPATPAALGTRRLNPPSTPPFPLCHHTHRAGGNKSLSGVPRL